MPRVIFLSILFALVYSWEELKRTARAVFHRVIFGHRKLFGRDGAIETDQMVSSLVIFATIPVSLFYLLAGSGEDVFRRFGILVLVLLGISAVAYISGVPAGFSLMSLVSPMMGVVGGAAALPRKLLSRFALYLSIPPAVGLVMRYAVNYSAAPEDLLPNLNLLIFVLVGALFMQVAAEFLERYFRRYRFPKLFSYYRVALGVVLAWILLAG